MNGKTKKRCRGLLLNCSMLEGHRGDCVPKKRAVRLVRKEFVSRCAGKCNHQWCDGYDAGYGDGYDDGNSDKGVKP
jgi:hypothetical protein